MEIVLATRNPGKIREFRHFFKEIDVNFKSLNDYLKSPEIKEDGCTFEENAIIKAKTIAVFLKRLVAADDSGLQVDFLNGKPGVHSARYSGSSSTDESNRQKLLKELKNADSLSLRTARFKCSLVLWDYKEGLIFKTTETCEGFIGFDEKGEGGFGYDSIFIPSGSKKTMAELTEDEKNRISHRGKALKKLHNFLKGMNLKTC